MNIFTRFFIFIALVILSNVSIAQTSFYWKSIAAAEDYTVAIKYDGTLWSWGRNQHGQLGDGTKIDKNSPIQIGTAADWMQASANGGHSVAVKTNGDLYSWGKNDNGQLGDGTTTERSAPIRVGTAKWKAAYAGDGFTIGADIASTNIMCGWGKNDKGQLVTDIAQLTQSLVPIKLPMPNKYPNSSVPLHPTWYSFSVGKNHVVGVGSDMYAKSPSLPTDPREKDVIVWGDNSFGQLGMGNISAVQKLDSLNVDKLYEKIATNYAHTLALKRDGSLWTWGNNTDGQLATDPASLAASLEPVAILAGQQWIDIKVGNNFSLAIRADGTLWTWGANDKGQLGNGTTGGNSWQPVQEASLSTDWEMLSAGDKFAFAVKKDGSIWAWGDNEYGQLGIGNNNHQNQPTLLTFSQFPATFERVANIQFPNLVKGAMVWGDYDNDGHLDVFISGSAKTTSTANRAELWKNNGNHTFTKVESAVFTPMSNTSVFWIDFNNDGLLDIFVSGSTSSSRSGAASKLYKNNGNGTFTEITEPVPNPTTAENNSYGKKFPGIWNASTKAGAEWADIDNDGFIDLIISGLTQTNVAVTRIYKNNGNEKFTLIPSTFPSSINSSLSWIDYDNDGYKDLAIQVKISSSVVYTQLYKNNAGLSFTEVAKQDAPFTNIDAAGITWGDYNNDGLPDVLVAGGISGIEYTDLYKNIGNGKFSKLTNTGLTGVDKAAVVMVDMDADGLQDIVIGGNIGGSTSLMAVKYFKNNGNDTFEELATPFYQVKNTEITYADINGDGKPDLLIGGHNNTEGTTNLYLNITNATSTLPSQARDLSANLVNGNKVQLNWLVPNTISGTGKYNIRLGTASGKNDVISGLNNQQLIFPNNQQPSFLPNITIDATKEYYYSVQVVDAAGNKSAWSPEYKFTVETLPVTLESFNVKKESNSVKISWTTVSENNNNRFEIERAGDDGRFVTIATVKPLTAEGRRDYFTYDYRPLNGNNYYRLKQYDNNGDNATYETKLVNFSIVANASANVYPIPSNGSYINISLNNVANTALALRVVDINGRIIHQQQLGNTADNTHRVDFANKLNNGIYFIQLTGNQIKETVKLIVQ